MLEYLTPQIAILILVLLPAARPGQLARVKRSIYVARPGKSSNKLDESSKEHETQLSDLSSIK